MEIISQTLNKTLVLFKNKYYLISTSTVRDETLIFVSNKNGQIWDWTDVGAGESAQIIIENFQAHLYKNNA